MSDVLFWELVGDCDLLYSLNMFSNFLLAFQRPGRDCKKVNKRDKTKEGVYARVRCVFG